MGIWKRHIDIYEELSLVDTFIRESLKSNQRVLDQALKDLLNRGGKKLRPALLLLAAQFGQYDRRTIIPLASAVEILHMATLVHDDVIDESDLRRGRPTTGSRFGNDVAVFTGDFLFTRAFSLITRTTSPDNMHHLAYAIKAICEGEIDQFEARYKSDISSISYLKRIARKTAVLFSLSSYVGAVEGKCSNNEAKLLKKLGHDFGMAFQITDDILDYSGDESDLGKPLLSDFQQGVYTLPVIYTYENDKYEDRIRNYMGRDDLEPEEIIKVGQLVEQGGGLDYARGMARTYIERCRDHLKDLPDKEAKGPIGELLDELIGRKR
ncbi:MAG TPA: polyprenyl synthetase family protein [Bacillota bacterium]|nr:polyprenyl synthetase family protein [Bacillota bacterium]